MNYRETRRKHCAKTAAGRNPPRPTRLPRKWIIRIYTILRRRTCTCSRVRYALVTRSRFNLGRTDEQHFARGPHAHIVVPLISRRPFARRTDYNSNGTHSYDVADPNRMYMVWSTPSRFFAEFVCTSSNYIVYIHVCRVRCVLQL